MSLISGERARLKRLVSEQRRAELLVADALRSQPLPPERLVERGVRTGLEIDALRRACDRLGVEVDPHGRLRLSEEEAPLA